MTWARYALVAALTAACFTPAIAGDEWDYPNAGRRGVNHVSAGRAGQLRVFDCETTDRAEDVVAWYGMRLGMPSDHGLLVAASEGFAQLENDLHVTHGFGHDTDKRKDHTQLVAHITKRHAHVTFVHRPDLNTRMAITISISQTPTGASVHVIQP